MCSWHDIKFTEVHNVDISGEILRYNSNIKWERYVGFKKIV